MQPLLAAVASLLLLSWGGDAFAQEDKDLYLWKDRRGKTHLTEEPPREDGSVQEQISSVPAPPPAATRRPAEEAIDESRREDSRERCRLAAAARQLARTTRGEADGLKERAVQARRKAEEFKERVGDDDDRLDDFKDDIRRLEEKAQWLEDLARQAALQADAADLQTRLAQSAAGDRCP